LSRAPEFRGPFTNFKTSAAIALAALACGSPSALAQTPNAPSPSPGPSAEMGYYPQGVVDVGTIAVAHAPDKYSTENLPPILKRIGGCETNNSPKAKINYKAENPNSTASGGFQFLFTTWNNFMGYREAKDAPARVQNKKAIMTYKSAGTGPWKSSQGCWG
jgi:hypothetical protein